MNKKNFETWLVDIDGKTYNSAYSYKNAIPKLSKHFSEQTNKETNLEELDINKLKEICEYYKQGGRYAEFGENSKGINRNALIALIRYKKAISKKDYPNFSVFFGKISNQNNQLDDKFYLADEKIWFNELREGDYVYAIGDGKIRLWKADKWISEENSYKMTFIEILSDLRINTKDLQSFKHFKLNVDLVVKTVRSTAKSKRAFFKIETHNDFKKENLLDLNFYQSQENYRSLKNTENIASMTDEVFDIQIYKDEGEFRIKLPSFSNDLGTFIDNTKFIGKGQKNKDKTLKNILEGNKSNWHRKEVSMINLYDAFFCNYDINATALDKSFLELFEEWLDAKHNSTTHVDLLNQTRLVIDDLIGKDILNKNLLDTLDSNTLRDFDSYLKKSKPIIYNISYLLEFLNANIMPENIFKKFETYLCQSNFTESTINAYVSSVSHKVPLEWKAMYQTEFSSFSLTLDNLKRLKKITRKTYQGEFKGKENFKSFLSFLIENYNTKMPLNQILYGPPGTGKTYKTKELAVNIILGERKRTRKEILNLYKDLKQQEQINFTTFHQSMSYEDFVEGIKPVMTNEDDESLKYDIEKGIFKRISAKAKGISGSKKKDSSIDFAKSNYFKMSLGGKNKLEVHNWCIENNLVALGWGDNEDYSEYKDIKNWTKFRDKFKKDLSYLVDGSKYHIEAMFRFQKMKVGDIVLASLGNHVLDAIGVIEGDYNYDADNQFGYHHNRKIKWLATNMNASPELFIDKGISQQSIYEFNKQDIKVQSFRDYFSTPDKPEVKSNHVLIIDEINRGNISSIFGELITLLEKDKRSGADEEIEVILPYSKEPFTVPSNLYIIGTMNTADRSVETLDTALRRRFSFTEIAPNPSILKEENTEGGIVDEIDLIKLLNTINGRIELLLDKDHKIGHSYFISALSFEDIAQIFKDKVIPLLEEYFYGDFGKIGLVLGKAFIEPVKDNNKTKLATFDHEDIEILSERKMFRFTESTKWNERSFKSIYDTTIVLDD